VRDRAAARPSRAELDSLALAAGIVAPLSWGMTGIFVRLLHGVPTLGIVAARLVVAVVVLSPWILRRRDRWAHAIRNPWALAMGAYYVLATEAFVRAPVVDVTLLVGTAPIVAVGLERLRGHRAQRQQLMGALIAVVGLVWFLRPDAGISAERGLGYLFALGAAAASAAYAVGLRAQAEAGRPLDALSLTVAACVLGATASLALLAGDGALGALVRPSAVQMLHLVLLGVLSTAIPTLAFGIASSKLPSVLTTSLGLMTPLFAALFAGLLLGEWPTATAVPGALIALTGVVLVLRAPIRVPRPS
jgi:drug/metabolite transporter (DMT)-like permease